MRCRSDSSFADSDTFAKFMICITALVMDDLFVKTQLFVKRLD